MIRKLFTTIVAACCVGMAPAQQITVTEGYDKPITSPEGRTYLSNMYISGVSVGIDYEDKVYTDTIEGHVTDVVLSDDGKYLYIKNPFISNAIGFWIKGEIDDDLVTFPPQVVQTYNASRFYAVRIKEDSRYGYVPDYDNLSFTFTYKDGVLRQTPGQAYGFVDERGDWAVFGWGEKDYIYIAEDTVTMLPTGVSPQEWSIQTEEGSMKVDMAFVGKDVYLGGLYDYLPGTYAKGVIDGDKVIFTGAQYLGADKTSSRMYDFAIYFRPCRLVNDMGFEEFKPAEKLVFDYDSKLRTLKTDSVIVVGIGKNRVRAKKYWEAPFLAYYGEEFPAVPANPVPVSHREYDPATGIAGYAFTLVNQDVDGNYINADNLYYNIWLDDQLYTFTPDLYVRLTEPMTDVPYAYSDGYDFEHIPAYNQVYVYVTGFDRMGVQSVYKVDGVVNKSDIVYWDGSVVSGIETAVKGYAGVVCTEYYDMSGRRVSAPSKGVYVKVTRLADGSTESGKLVVK